jgi:hypothetical protein
MKSLNTIAMQPEKMSNKIEVIMCMDLAGKRNCDIARELGMTDARISIIRNSPLYSREIESRREALMSEYRDKQTDRLVTGDPVTTALKEAALEAARVKIEVMKDGKSEFARLAASGDILDRAGYKAHQEKTRVSIEITDKMADRFEKALSFYGGSRLRFEVEETSGG